MQDNVASLLYILHITDFARIGIGMSYLKYSLDFMISFESALARQILP